MQELSKPPLNTECAELYANQMNAATHLFVGRLQIHLQNEVRNDQIRLNLVQTAPMYPLERGELGRPPFSLYRNEQH